MIYRSCASVALMSLVLMTSSRCDLRLRSLLSTAWKFSLCHLNNCSTWHCLFALIGYLPMTIRLAYKRSSSSSKGARIYEFLISWSFDCLHIDLVEIASFCYRIISIIYSISALSSSISLPISAYESTSYVLPSTHPILIVPAAYASWAVLLDTMR